MRRLVITGVPLERGAEGRLTLRGWAAALVRTYVTYIGHHGIAILVPGSTRAIRFATHAILHTTLDYHGMN